jgi:hypothetical protein
LSEAVQAAQIFASFKFNVVAFLRLVVFQVFCAKPAADKNSGVGFIETLVLHPGGARRPWKAESKHQGGSG